LGAPQETPRLGDVGAGKSAVSPRRTHTRSLTLQLW